LVGGTIGIWTLKFAGQRLPVKVLLGILIAGAAVSASIFPYNYALTGKATYTPHQKWSDHIWYEGADRLGFGPDVGNLGWPHIDPFPGHGLLDIVVNAYQNIYNVNFELFGWGFGSLIFASLFFIWGRWRREDILFLLVVLFITAGHSVYWFSGGPDFGARYWYQIILPLIVLTIRGIQELKIRLSKHGMDQINLYRVDAIVIFACIIAVINFIPWRSLDKYYHYRGMRSDIAELAEKCGFNDSLVFVQELDKSDYPSAFIFNPVDLNSGQTIYVRDLGPEVRNQVIENFPNRSIWTVRGSEELGGNFSIVDNPRSPQDGEPIKRPEDCQ
jgi:hypothetical protein